MAKRKRLTPAQADYLGSAPARLTGPGLAAGAAPMAPAPIAQVSGDASARAALADLAAEMETARAQGLMLELLPLSSIDVGHLVRDRLVQDEDEMAALMASLQARGQQTPIEVVRLPAPQGGKTHGLISGWRRLTALSRLYDSGKDPRFAAVRAVVVAPDSAQSAYVAMVEENEIRVNLSHYERARIALRAVEEGVYDSRRAALLSLYSAAPRAKRSKIGSFMTLVEALDPVLKFPTAIPEKAGLALARALAEDPDLASRLTAQLSESPAVSAEKELRILAEAAEPTAPAPTSAPEISLAPAPVSAPDAIKPTAAENARSPISDSDTPALRGAVERAGPRETYAGPIPSAPRSVVAAPGVQMIFDRSHGRIDLSGEAVDQTLFEALQIWLAQRDS
ncbi:ParB/RepB/Spo0J family partition protein [Antarcticimicrobium sediminis]|uniref:Chromosome partitioning protein ParB n=1 Tax=Antarcticimicrobium sediminis TaxID=2546227 RepID=A0A4R5EI88_9RHOB|nr:ParB N-terminal domain-containing protein [Antarcticimicrobium sediminis]TDE34241.1 chromosome partitioning protein ParB [Antarcticimicrobium sediminis]